MSPSPSKPGEPFFTVLAVVALAVVVAGFAPSFYLRGTDHQPLSPMFLWHGISLTAWYVLAIVQSALVGIRFSAGKLRVHQRLGMAATLIAIAVIYTGIAVAFDFYNGGTTNPILTPEGLLVANLMNLVSFAVCFVAGVALRKKPELHKRFLSLAGIVMIGPAAFRLVVSLGLAPPMSLIIQFGLVAAMFVYDRRRLQRISKASWIGVLLIVLMIVVTLAVG
ncbi:MAG: hypothetical protein ACI89X_003802 [Planctomycetota bacterium]